MTPPLSVPTRPYPQLYRIMGAIRGNRAYIEEAGTNRETGVRGAGNLRCAYNAYNPSYLLYSCDVNGQRVAHWGVQAKDIYFGGENVQ